MQRRLWRLALSYRGLARALSLTRALSPWFILTPSSTPFGSEGCRVNISNTDLFGILPLSFAWLER